jgi:hypothetical protein
MIGSFAFIVFFTGLFIILLLSTVTENLWFFGLQDGNGIINEEEQRFTRDYKVEFDRQADDALKPIDEMIDVPLDYRWQLKNLIKSNVGVGIGIARVLSFAMDPPNVDSLPDPEWIMKALAPAYHYRPIQNDSGKRGHIIEETHTVAVDKNSRRLTESTYSLPSHQVMEQIDISTGKIRLIHTKKTSAWKTINETWNEKDHWVYADGKKVKCKIIVYEKVEEQEVRTKVDDSKPPVVIKEEGKLDIIMYALGMKSEKDIKLVYEIARGVKGYVHPGSSDYRPDCPSCNSPPNFSDPPWYWPLPGYTHISSLYGPRWGNFHHGIDIPAPIGAPVIAALDGVVAYAGTAAGYGNVIYINHGQGLQTRYGHMSQLWVQTGDEVRAGERIASNGNEGRSTGAHLHFEIRIGVTMNNQFSKTIPSIDPAEVYAIPTRKKVGRR